jgi:hypothetical protein
MNFTVFYRHRYGLRNLYECQIRIKSFTLPWKHTHLFLVRSTVHTRYVDFLFGLFSTGVIRDVSGSYNLCIGFINLLTLTTLIMWTVEIIIIRHRHRDQRTTDDTDGD